MDQMNINDASCGQPCCGGQNLNHTTPEADERPSLESTSSNLCNSDDVCNESCIKTAAAIECSLACAEETERKGVSDPQNSQTTCVKRPLESRNGCNSQFVHAEGEEENRGQHRHIHNEAGEHPDEPCEGHMRDAMNRYAAYLETARCICRSILQSTGVSLHCSPPRKSQSGGEDISNTRHHLTLRDHQALSSPHLKVQKTKELIQTDHRKSCDSSENSCRVVHQSVETPKIESTDIEKSASVSHILLNVAGMDCSGCGNNLSRALNMVVGVSAVRVIFVNGTAELDIDTNIVEIGEVLRRAQRATGYKLTPFSSDTQTLDLIMIETEARKMQIDAPHGVVWCEKLTKTTYEISYDPCIIGARDIMAHVDAQLAPPRGGSYTDAGMRRLLHISAMTALAFMFTIPVVVLEWSDVNGVSERTTLLIGLILATFVQAIAIPEFYKPAVSSLVYNKVVEMDMLVVISITAAYGYSIVAFGLIFAGANPETSPFFETSTLLISLILLGRLLAAWARKRAVQAVSLRTLQAPTAMLIDQNTNQPREIDARLLQFGDKIFIGPHCQVVTDADVLRGTSEVDESMLTGESMPVLKNVGSTIVSGTINGNGILTARVARLPGKNTITDIAHLVEQAQSCKPRIQDLADRVAGYFIPAVCTAALVVFVIWLVVGLKVRNQSTGSAIGTAIGYCIAVLAISCPCALGLAVPMVLVVAGGVAARGGVIIKTADVIERGFKVTDIVFDKTGTLTRPELEVVHEVIFSGNGADREQIRSLVMSMTSGNKHPISEAITASLKAGGSLALELTGLAAVPGCGVEAEWNGKVVRAGNARWLRVNELPEVVNLTARGLSMLFVTINNELVAMFGLKSVLRDGAIELVRELHRRQIAVHIVSGDGVQAVRSVAEELNVSMEKIAAERNPQQKQEYIRQLMDQGKITMFCGDGTNDAVAVAQANVGVQIESSSDVTRATADVVLLRNLDGVISLLDTSRAAFRRIIFNFCWSATYNILAILLAGGAFVKIRIPPAYAGLGEIVSVLPVIVVALTQPKMVSKM